MSEWNIACSYGAHTWVRGTRAATGTTTYPSMWTATLPTAYHFMDCLACGASYQCSEATWRALPERAS